MRAPSLGPLEEREFRLLFLAQAASSLGDRFALVALAFGVLDITGSAADVGYVLSARTICVVAFVLVGGVWADRIKRQRVMLASDGVRALAQGVTAALLITGAAEVWHLVALQALYGAAEAFFSPASTGLVPESVSAPRLQHANALMGLSRNATAIVGPALAGVVVAVAGAGWAVAVDGLSFLLSAWFLACMRLPDRVHDRATTFVHELRDGWREFRTRSWVWASVLHFSAFHLFVLAPFFVLGPFLSERELGGPAAWATILTASGIGSLAGGILGLRFRPARLLVAAYAFMALWTPQMALLAVVAPTGAIAAAALAGSFGLTFATTLWFTALQQHIPERAMSRVSAYDWLGSLAFMPLGYAVTGPVAEAVGTRTTLWLSAGWLAASSAAVLAVPGVRSLRRNDPEAPVASRARTRPPAPPPAETAEAVRDAAGELQGRRT